MNSDDEHRLMALLFLSCYHSYLLVKDLTIFSLDLTEEKEELRVVRVARNVRLKY